MRLRSAARESLFRDELAVSHAMREPKRVLGVLRDDDKGAFADIDGNYKGVVFAAAMKMKVSK